MVAKKAQRHFTFFTYIQSYNLGFEAIEPTKQIKEMTKKKRINFVDVDIGQILIITVQCIIRKKIKALANCDSRIEL